MKNPGWLFPFSRASRPRTAKRSAVRPPRATACHIPPYTKTRARLTGQLDALRLWWPLKMEKLLSGFLNSKGTVRVACVAVVFLYSGFVHAPFARWATGEVTEIHSQQMTFAVRDAASKKVLPVRWNEETRLWIEPTRRNDRGSAFDASQIKTGALVQIMFKKYSDHNLVTRVIRLAPPKGPREKIADGGSPPSGREFPDTPKKK